ncbi:sigma-70 family RNA polymerase sigma factor [Salininema proteolyticum]|uniref:Sigma-70 family RNA polymerase sigma factor n=1 Tax=Salininema proteolyticum TaxID=1607685 RepID=A0ABV8U2Z6_9ACTN
MSIDTAEFEPYRRELRAYAYRMLGSASEAEDAVQETFIKAWKRSESFEGRSSLRTWLYKIATNVCLDMSKAVQRRIRPMDLRSAGSPDQNPLETMNPEATWLTPAPDSWMADPSTSAESRESVRLAFVSAVQHLPARQRAALIMREVLAFSAKETADTLDLSASAVNSALQRARATMEEVRSVSPTPQVAAKSRSGAGASEPSGDPDEDGESDAELAESYAKAFEAFDIDRLKTLLHRDVVMSMPPLELWLRGPRHFGEFLHGPGNACEGSKLVPISANGSIAFGHYKPSGNDDGLLTPWSITVLETEGGVITGLNYFLDTQTLFPLFDLKPTLAA